MQPKDTAQRGQHKMQKGDWLHVKGSPTVQAVVCRTCTFGSFMACADQRPPSRLWEHDRQQQDPAIKLS